MNVLRLNQFPGALTGARTWMSVQRLWTDHPEVRPQLATGMMRLCRVVNDVVVRKR